MPSCVSSALHDSWPGVQLRSSLVVPRYWRLAAHPISCCGPQVSQGDSQPAAKRQRVMPTPAAGVDAADASVLDSAQRGRTGGDPA